MKASMITLLGAAAAVSAHTGYTTSTIRATSTITVTSCAPEVTDCPAGPHVTTVVVDVSTTVCPVTATETSPPKYPTTKPAGPIGGTSTSTALITKVITISSCAPTVTDCPYTTKPITSTYVVPAPPATTPVDVPGAPAPPASVPDAPAPPASSPPAAPAPPASVPGAPAPPAVPTSLPSGPLTSAVVPPPSTLTSVTPPPFSTGGIPSPPSNGTTPSPPSPPITNGAVAQSASGLLFVVGLVAALF